MPQSEGSGVNDRPGGPRNNDGAPRPGAGLSRRTLLAGAGAAGALAATAGCGSRAAATRPNPAGRPGAAGGPVAFFGPHQAGITTPQQAFLYLAAFDLDDHRADTLRDLLRAWSDQAAQLTAGDTATATDAQLPGPTDPGEAAGLGPANLTATFGLGATLFERDGEDPLGLRSRRPATIILPAATNDAEDARASGGDLAIQICADDPTVAFHALHVLQRTATGAATPRWVQSGFRDLTTRDGHGSHRNLLGFKDGITNLDTAQRSETARSLWVGANESPAWMRDGTYLVARRFRFLFDVWDTTERSDQERTIGRRKASGAPLSGTHEDDHPNFSAERDGTPLIPTAAHIRQAAPETNGGAKLLRRSFNYSNGIDPDTGQIDAGLQFICFQRDPAHQFAPIQRRLAESDALSRHITATASAIFACPPGARAGGFVGEQLFVGL
jgi:deferrochelatase/peroxidase EfeB